MIFLANGLVNPEINFVITVVMKSEHQSKKHRTISVIIYHMLAVMFLMECTCVSCLQITTVKTHAVDNLIQRWNVRDVTCAILRNQLNSGQLMYHFNTIKYQYLNIRTSIFLI